MKTKHTLLLFFLFSLILIKAQTITFISQNTNLPLPKVSVFGIDGNILAISDIEGKIDKSLISKDQENFQLIFENESIATLPYSAFENSIIKLNDRTKNIEPVIIKNGKPAKYIIIKGNFTTYVTLNKKLNCYADGIVSYVFEQESGKLKSTNVLQYRIYTLKNAKNTKKNTSTWDYESFLKVPELKKAGDLEAYKSKKAIIKNLQTNDKDVVEIGGSALTEKEFAIFGYRIYDINNLLSISFEKNSKKQLRNLLDYNSIFNLKLRHKTEDNYNQIVSYNNFYTTELDFSNDKNIEDVKFNKDKSNYKTEYWKDTTFPNLQIIFSSYFKDDLILK
jgi:hypothetical protein